jgi:integrase
MKMTEFHPSLPPGAEFAATAIVWSAASLREAVCTWDLPESRRRAFVTSINNTDRIVSASAEVLNGVCPWTCEGLNRVLWRRAPACFGLTGHAFRATTSGLRQVFIRLGLHANSGPGRNHLSSKWQVLFEALPTDDRRRGLIRFFAFLTISGIDPEQLQPEAIDEFAVWCRTSILVEDGTGMARRAAGNWTFARLNVPGWPDVKLRKSSARDHYTLSLDSAQLSFQADAKRFLDLLAAGPADCFSGATGFEEITDDSEPVGPPKALRPRSIKTRSDQIRLAYSALALTGSAPSSLHSLRDLVDPIDHPRRIFSFLRDRLRAKKLQNGENPSANELRSSQLAGMADLLLQIARHYVRPRLTKEHIAQLALYASRVRPEVQGTMTVKNADRLRSILEPTTFAKMVHLPGLWLKRADDEQLDQHERALSAMYAAALEILLVAPLRRSNVISMHLDRHLRRSSLTGPVTEITIPSGEIKNSETFNWPIEPGTARRLERYVREFRPKLLNQQNRYLFPGGGIKHRDEAEFAHELSRRVERDIGAAFNMHLCRHLCVVRFLRRHPGQYEIVRRALGHRSVATTIAFYAGLEAAAAAKMVNRALFEDREETKLTAAAAFKGTSRRSRGRTIRNGSPVFGMEQVHK